MFLPRVALHSKMLAVLNVVDNLTDVGIARSLSSVLGFLQFHHKDMAIVGSIAVDVVASDEEVAASCATMQGQQGNDELERDAQRSGRVCRRSRMRLA